MTSPSKTLLALGRSNVAILRQKLGLIDVMRTKLGDAAAKDLYRSTCPIVQASIGQHVRHSVDHTERVARVMKQYEPLEKIHYDLRERGGEDEQDMDKAEERISAVMNDLTECVENGKLVSDSPVTACFMLSSDGNEFDLHSTIERELGFAAHHAIHHMSSIGIIALNTVGLDPSDLPTGFGRAPSTANHDKLTSKK